MNSIFLKTLNKEKTKRPPIWFMRQAGRILPSYMSLRKKYSFRQLMSDPVLASKITRLPIDDLDVDAAILFSDILVIPESLGMNVDFKNTGPEFKKLLDINNLNLNFESKKLNYIYKNIKQTKIDLKKNIPLIGFCGGPLTVFLFMLKRGRTQKDLHDVAKLIYSNKEESIHILNKITEASISYVESQVNSGIDCFQLFETYCGIVPEKLYTKLILPLSEKILYAAKKKGCKTIFFPKNYNIGYKKINHEFCDFVSVDWQMDLVDARKLIDKKIGIQGNIDPRIFYSTKKDISSHLESLSEFGKNNYDWIFNLGHGFMPGINLDNVKYTIEWIKRHNWKRI